MPRFFSPVEEGEGAKVWGRDKGYRKRGHDEHLSMRDASQNTELHRRTVAYILVARLSLSLSLADVVCAH